MIQSSYISDEELMLLSRKNPQLHFERNRDGTLKTMTPTGKISGNREAKAIAYLLTWVESNNLGEVFSSSCGVKLPNGAIRSADAIFVARERLPQGWDQGEDEFLNIVPDFMIEIRSKTDNLEDLKAKMQEYIENGVKLAWLIDRKNKQAFVYRADGSITQYPEDTLLTGESIVPGFRLPLKSML
ncbi:protein of unknown function DUF820 [Gloeothece citriformis PCC 7424]|uniref:Putative restriction endonuclease domain-containing protein n=1 Tax=Gloeothece citriformis (strain PCC 7424) TaxID=65393 RepID=B7K8U3_GLOC7|nr:Uma2 family endonuclease [Gloeothece citriformis]ACK71291.1 protein of unknown function DUF820 [Gloeothece citriformis PCC 7424]